MIKTVLIDVDDTLIDYTKSYREAVRTLFDRLSLPFSQHIIDVYEEICPEMWHRVKEGEITPDYLREHRWETIFKALNIEGFDSIETEKLYREELAKTDFIIDGAKETLEYLSKKYTVCTASNASINQQKPRLDKCGLSQYIDYMFMSAEIGYEKPDVRFFEGCFERLNFPPKEEVIMIGDSPYADLDGAQKFGIKTIWYNIRNKTLSSKKTDYEVKNLKEIMNIL